MEDTATVIDDKAGSSEVPARSAAMIPAIAEDGTLFPIEKLEAHRKGQFHLAISVFVFSGNELLLQQRAAGKYHCGNQWANTCCTHPHWEEDAAACATRRLQEELGFTLPVSEHRIVEYKADVGNGLIENERVHMFSAQADKATLKVDLNLEEVQAVRWTTANALSADMAANPHTYTPWLRIYLQRFPDLQF